MPTDPKDPLLRLSEPCVKNLHKERVTGQLRNQTLGFSGACEIGISCSGGWEKISLHACFRERRTRQEAGGASKRGRRGISFCGEPRAPNSIVKPGSTFTVTTISRPITPRRRTPLTHLHTHTEQRVLAFAFQDSLVFRFLRRAGWLVYRPVDLGSSNRYHHPNSEFDLQRLHYRHGVLHTARVSHLSLFLSTAYLSSASFPRHLPRHGVVDDAQASASRAQDGEQRARSLATLHALSQRQPLPALAATVGRRGGRPLRVVRRHRRPPHRLLRYRHVRALHPHPAVLPHKAADDKVQDANLSPECLVEGRRDLPRRARFAVEPSMDAQLSLHRRNRAARRPRTRQPAQRRRGNPVQVRRHQGVREHVSHVHVDVRPESRRRVGSKQQSRPVAYKHRQPSSPYPALCAESSNR